MIAHFITHPVDGSDVICPGEPEDLLAQVFNMAINEIKIISEVHVITPEMFGNGRLGKHTVFIGNKKKEQVEFFFMQGPLPGY